MMMRLRLVGLDDHELAGELATRTGSLLAGLRAAHDYKDPVEVGDAGDRSAQEFLAEALARARPEDAVLSEEAKDDSARRLGAGRVWIIDPLDGTREFGRVDSPDWAVHVALWEEGRLTAGAVALPALGKTLRTGDARTRRVRMPGSVLRIVVSPGWEFPEYMSGLGRTLSHIVQFIPKGSAGAKIAAIVLGDAEAYILDARTNPTMGPLHEWDLAAPVAVATAAGAQACRFDGTELTFNQPGTQLIPDLVVCHPGIKPEILGAIK